MKMTCFWLSIFMAVTGLNEVTGDTVPVPKSAESVIEADLSGAPQSWGDYGVDSQAYALAGDLNLRILSKRSSDQDRVLGLMLENDSLRKSLSRAELMRNSVLTISLLLFSLTLLGAVYVVRMHSREEVEKKAIMAELALVNGELTSQALQAAQVSGLCDEVIHEVEHSMQKLDQSDRCKLMRIVGDLKQKSADDRRWCLFEKQFRALNPDFYPRLLTLSSDLTATEMKICALLRLNMNTKDIAELTCRSPRTVESTRLSIRKKLSLEKADCLTTWLMAV